MTVGTSMKKISSLALLVRQLRWIRSIRSAYIRSPIRNRVKLKIMLESTWLTQWLLFGGSWRRRISVAVHLLFQIGLGRHLLLCPCKSQLAKVLQRKRNWFNWCLLWSTYSKKLEMTALWETTKCRTTSVNWRLGLTTVADTMVVAIRKRMFVSMSIQVTPAFWDAGSVTFQRGMGGTSTVRDW